MMIKKLTSFLLMGTALGAFASVAHAQTADAPAATNIGKVSATGVSTDGDTGKAYGGGLITDEDAPKSRSSITRDYIERQTPTENPYQEIKLLPGVNAYSSDPTGLTGGGLQIRGFNSDEVGFTIEGAPVNDSGNYAIYPQEYVDTENIGQIIVTPGGVDIDAPHIGAAGGQVNVIQRDPLDIFNIHQTFTFGEHYLFRTYTSLDTGLIGTYKAYISASHAQADNFRGVGSADKTHVDAKVVDNMTNGDHWSVSLIFNHELNNSYRDVTSTQFHLYGRNYNYDDKFVAGDTNFYAQKVNPFDNAIVSANGTFRLSDNLQYDVIPYFWYGYGNGGGVYSKNETGGATLGSLVLPPTDLNGNGTTTDRGVLVYSPSITQTYRPGLINKLTYFLDNQKFIAGYWVEYGYQQQTAPYSPVDQTSGVPANVWGDVNTIVSPNGVRPQRRDQLTETYTNQFFVGDEVSLLNDHMKLTIGLKQALDTRYGTNHVPGYPHNPSLADQETLPQAAVSYKFWDAHQLFASFYTGFRSPANYDLFDSSVQRNQKTETSEGIDIGYRYQTDLVVGSITGFGVNMQNRQQSITLPDNTFQDLNVGRVDKRGVEAEIGTAPIYGFRPYVSYAHTDATLKDNYPEYIGGVLTYLKTAGKTDVRTPKELYGFGVDYDNGGFFAGVQAKYTSSQQSTLMNDEQMNGYATVDLNMGYKFTNVGYFKNPKVLFNITNVLDRNYLTGLDSFSTNAKPTVTTNGSVYGAGAPSYIVGGSRFFSITFSSDF